MSNIDFPTAPVDGQIFQANNGSRYRYQMPPGLWTTASPDGAAGEVFDMRDYGGSTENANNTTAFNAANNAAFAAGGGTIYFAPGTWKFLSYIEMSSGVAMRGVPGKTQLDFSDHPGFEGSMTEGLIRAQGSLAPAVPITHDVVRTVIVPLRVQTATRAGTVVTAEVDMPHGYKVGDPIWVIGFPDTAGQAVFFTLNFYGTGTSSSGRTDPFLVTSIIDTKRFTYAIVADVGDATLTTTANVTFASDILIVANTAPFSVNQDVMIQSDAYRFNVTSEKNNLGEFAKIAKIVSPTMLRLHSDVQDDYTQFFVDKLGVTQPANIKVAPVTFYKNFAVEGFEIIGKGPNTLPPTDPNKGGGDRGIMAYLCESPRVRLCTFTRVDYNGVYIWSCMGGTVHSNLFSWDASDEAGSSSGVIDVQYGVGFGGCTVGLEIRNNHFWGGRHAIVQTFASTGVGGLVFYGVSRHISTVGNSCQGQWLAAISSHQGVDTWVIVGNTINGAYSGINPRYCRDLVMSDNVITAFNYGIQVYNYIGNFIASANTIRSGVYGLFIGRDIDPATDYGPLKIINNNIEGGTNGVLVLDTTLGTTTDDIDVSGNTIRATVNEAIRIYIGDIANAANGWTGKVNNNSIVDAGLAGNLYGMRLTNFKGGQVNNNTFKGPTALNYALYVDGAGTGNSLQFMDNFVQAGLVVLRTIQCTVGTWHRTNMPPITLSDAVAQINSVGAIAPIFARLLICIDTFGSTEPTDDLDTIAPGYPGQLIILRSSGMSRVISVRDVATSGTGNINTAGGATRVLDSTRDTMTLVWDNLSWNEIAFSSN